MKEWTKLGWNESERHIFQKRRKCLERKIEREQMSHWIFYQSQAQYGLLMKHEPTKREIACSPCPVGFFLHRLTQLRALTIDVENIMNSMAEYHGRIIL